MLRRKQTHLSTNDAEDIVVSLNDNKSTATEDNFSVNTAIQEGELSSGEINIDRQGLIHHPVDDPQ